MPIMIMMNHKTFKHDTVEAFMYNVRIINWKNERDRVFT